MSRFFARGSDTESEESSSEEEFQTIQPKAAPVSRTYAWSDDEDDQKRVVRSEKDKRFEELQGIIKNLKNHRNIKDMASVLTDFEDLGRAYDRSRKIIEKEGVPKFYIKNLGELEDFVNECWEDREWRKTISKNNSKSLTTLRQRLKKYNRDFEEDIKKFKENPTDYDEELEEGKEEDKADDESEDEDEDKPVKEVVKAPVKQQQAKGDADSDFDDDWSSESSESSESDTPMELTASYFLKKRPGEEEKVKEKKVAKQKTVTKKVSKLESDEEDEGKWTEVKGSRAVPGVQEKPKIFPKDAEITQELVLKKLAEFMSNRGKKGTDRAQQVELLVELRELSQTANLGPGINVKLLFSIIGAIFDYNPNIATCMKTSMWEMCLKYVKEIQICLFNNKDTLVVGENIPEESEVFTGEGSLRVRGCILTTIERMDEEYIKMLQACDAHSTEYVDRLRDEPRIVAIIDDLVKYLDDKATSEEKCRAYIKKIEHMYYKFDANDAKGTYGIMNKLCTYIYAKDNTDRLRTRAILYQIYHHASHDRWFAARDLMLMSHLQDNIHLADIPTQILYNRAMVQLGLCAFRAGMVKDAHNCLVDIQSSSRAKELLAQGLLQRQHERTPEQEKIEKRRQMPYHMHINLELLECVYLVSAMLIEIPYMAAQEVDYRRRMISKNFYYRLRESDRQPLIGPPESMREHVVAAAKAMKKGDWSACHTFLINEKMNAKVWDLFQNSEQVKSQLTEKIKEESLRTYLFTFASVYDSVSLASLAHMYGLEKQQVHSVISKMIINEELMASLDEPSECVIMHRTDPTALQSLALQLSEKVSSLVENNERLMEMKSGNYYYQSRGGYQDQQKGNYQQSGNQQRNYLQNRGQNQDRGGYQKRQNYNKNYSGKKTWGSAGAENRQVRFQNVN